MLQRRETRRAVVLLRQACALDEHRARTFALLGALLLRLGHAAEAETALRHARWLRARAGEPGRAASTQRLLDRVHPAAA
jgi:Flp pilus assembly protein TadD